MRKLRTAAAIAVFALSCLAVTAQNPREDFKRDRNYAGSNHLAYPTPTAKLTPSPKGYEPVYFSHYGRHGSRYHIGAIYTKTLNILKRAKSLGILTPLGEETLTKVNMLREEARGRDGELTELGALQHRQIAERMYRNFPEIFSKPIHIDAKSTDVIRCILSMENAMQQLKSMNPALDIRHDASRHDMWFMNQGDTVLEKKKYQNSKVVDAFNRTHTHPDRLMSTLFTSESFWRDSINSGSLMHDLFDLTNNLQSSELAKKISMWDLFTDEEVYELWEASNAWWYMAYGPSKLSGGVQPYSQRNLLRRIISDADSCMMTGNVSANLRFGHDTMVMPLTCLLGLDGLDMQIDDLNTLATHGWLNYDIFPMACNIQFIFYRPVGGSKATRDVNGDVLIKVLRNEKEARLPLQTDQWPYYKWTDFRAFYLKKLDDYEASVK